jgi:hypothetical protein
MKNVMRFLVLAACIAPFGMVAAKDTPTPSQKSKLSRPIDGLTLLTGPDLLSPPIGAVKVSSSEDFYFRYSTTGRVVAPVPTDRTERRGRIPTVELPRFDTKLPVPEQKMKDRRMPQRK